jgi:hypothetical protein
MGSSGKDREGKEVGNETALRWRDAKCVYKGKANT